MSGTAGMKCDRCKEGFGEAGYVIRDGRSYHGFCLPMMSMLDTAARDSAANIERLTGQIEMLKAKHAEATTQLITRDRQIARLQEQLTAAEVKYEAAREDIRIQVNRLLGEQHAHAVTRSAHAALLEEKMAARMSYDAAQEQLTAAEERGRRINGEFAAQAERVRALGSTASHAVARVRALETALREARVWLGYVDAPELRARIDALTPAPATTAKMSQCPKCRYVLGHSDECASDAASTPATPKTGLCDHGINHNGERHGCDGCCKDGDNLTAEEKFKRMSEYMATIRERDHLRSEVNRLRELVERNLIVHETAVHEATKRAEEAEASAAVMRLILGVLHDPSSCLLRDRPGACRTCAVLANDSGHAFLERLREIDDECGALKEKLKAERNAHAATRAELERAQEHASIAEATRHRERNRESRRADNAERERDEARAALAKVEAAIADDRGCPLDQKIRDLRSSVVERATERDNAQAALAKAEEENVRLRESNDHAVTWREKMLSALRTQEAALGRAVAALHGAKVWMECASSLDDAEYQRYRAAKAALDAILADDDSKAAGEAWLSAVEYAEALQKWGPQSRAVERREKFLTAFAKVAARKVKP